MVDPEPLRLTPEIRRELIDYCKWIVGLATFILTLSIGLSAVAGEGEMFEMKIALYFGWTLLGLCMPMNWLLIKALLSARVIESIPEEEWGQLIRLQLSNLPTRLKIYGAAQNELFLSGFLLVGIGFASNI